MKAVSGLSPDRCHTPYKFREIVTAPLSKSQVEKAKWKLCSSPSDLNKP